MSALNVTQSVVGMFFSKLPDSAKLGLQKVFGVAEGHHGAVSASKTNDVDRSAVGLAHECDDFHHRGNNG